MSAIPENRIPSELQYKLPRVKGFTGVHRVGTLEALETVEKIARTFKEKLDKAKEEDPKNEQIASTLFEIANFINLTEAKEALTQPLENRDTIVMCLLDTAGRIQGLSLMVQENCLSTPSISRWHLLSLCALGVKTSSEEKEKIDSDLFIASVMHAEKFPAFNFFKANSSIDLYFHPSEDKEEFFRKKGATEVPNDIFTTYKCSANTLMLEL